MSKIYGIPACQHNDFTDNKQSILTDDEIIRRTTKLYLSVIYDISDTRRRTKLFKLLNSYGEHIQLSVFELLITKKQFREVTIGIEKIIDEQNGDEVRIYKVRKNNEILIYGGKPVVKEEDIIFV